LVGRGGKRDRRKRWRKEGVGNEIEMRRIEEGEIER
jgi:hypothetical protein